MEKLELGKFIEEKTQTFLKKIEEYWDELGHDEHTREHRRMSILKYVDELFTEMIKETVMEKDNLLDEIEKKGNELFSLKNMLQINSSNVSIDGYEDQPLLQVKKCLDEKLKISRKFYVEKKAQIEKINKEAEMLCKILGQKPIKLSTSPLANDADISNFKSHLDEMSLERFKMEEEFMKLKTNVINIAKELDFQPSLEFEKKILSEDFMMEVTSEVMQELNDFYDMLNMKKNEAETKSNELREKITVLWECLEEDLKTRSEFLDNNYGYSLPTLERLKLELKRLEQIKKNNIEKFISKLRSELNKYYEKCLMTEDEKGMFFYSDCYNEDLLALHELELKKLQQFYKSNENIFALLSKRAKLWERIRKLDELANAPNRFKNRGGQLLNEEKQRKGISAQLPKIEEEILHLVNEYEANTGKVFKMYGHKISEVIENDWHEYKINKKVHLSEKKKLREQITLTPSKPPIGSSNKRKLFTPQLEMPKKSRIETSALKPFASESKVKMLDRQKRLEKIRKKDYKQKINNTNYESFKTEIAQKSSCRSTLFPTERCLRSSSRALQESNGTPRRPLITITHTSSNSNTILMQSTNSRPKSPIPMSSRLVPVHSNLPIIL